MGLALGKKAILSNDNRTATGTGRFHAGPWVPRGRNAIATIRIDHRSSYNDAIKIQVVGGTHSLWLARYTSSWRNVAGTTITIVLTAACCEDPLREEKKDRCSNCKNCFRARTVTF